MKIRAVKIIDGAAPIISCQSEISQIKLVSKRPLNGEEIRDIFRMISDKQITLQLITVHITQIVFSVPCLMAGAVMDLFSQSEYRINAINDCAEVNISGVQVSDVPQITGEIIETLSSLNVAILHLTTSQSSVSVLVEQAHLPAARNTIHAALHLF
ncbi:MAG: hypothetical protein K0Q77_1878 [Anaerosporomusa subterranea]|nr:hypothetical protein [Anaerosporomusa subterranea]